ncbi:site-specific integrase [Listeria monocytogenes]|nr:site-specific integrase [Listeria monocytogenes]EBF5125253.1 site-specific integrase [Listeria monocytogenes]
MKRLKGSIGIYKNGWRMRVTIGYDKNGSPIRKAKMTYSKNGRIREKELNDFISEMEAINYFTPEKITFSNFVYNEWFPKHIQKNKAPKTAELYLSIIENRFIPKIGGTQLANVKPIFIVNIINDISRRDKHTNQSDTGKKEISLSTQKSILFAIKSVFKTAVEWGFIQSNPAEKLKIQTRGATNKKRNDNYNTEEFKKLMNAIKQEPIDWQLIMYLAVIDGAREGEIAAVEIAHIDIQQSTTTFQQTIIELNKQGIKVQNTTKNGIAKTISHPQFVNELLKKYISSRLEDKKMAGNLWEWNNHHFLFSNEVGKPLRPSSLRQRWKRFIERHHLRYIRFHDLRHTSATYLLTNGASVKTVQMRLGHKDYQTTMNIYAHVLKEVDQEAADTFNLLNE